MPKKAQFHPTQCCCGLGYLTLFPLNAYTTTQQQRKQLSIPKKRRQAKTPKRKTMPMQTKCRRCRAHVLLALNHNPMPQNAQATLPKTAKRDSFSFFNFKKTHFKTAWELNSIKFKKTFCLPWKIVFFIFLNA